MRHYLEVTDLDAAELEAVLDLAESEPWPNALAGAGVALIFQKPSLRTRSSFETAVRDLGGHPRSFRAEEVDVDGRETAEDVARAMGCYHALLAVRPLDQHTLDRMASVNALPIVNLLSDTGHPLQALADLLTVRQVHGGLHGVTLSFIGDFNNVAQSLTLAAALSGMNIRFGCPPAYAPGSEDLKRLVRLGATGAVAIHDAVEAAKGADVVYTDVWVAVGQEGETSTRLRDFAGFTVDRRVMDEALPGAIFLHCLPVRRGVEVAAEVVDGAASLVWQLARNRLSTARGLIQWLAGQPG